MKRLFISQSNYLPWVGYFDAIAAADEFWLYDIVQYTKNDWRNRNKIKSASGPQWLTIPVQVRTLSQAIDQTRVAQSNWAMKHVQTLKTNYGQAPYFDWVMEALLPVYQLNYVYLTDINRAFLQAVLALLQVETPMYRIEDKSLLTLDKNQRLVVWCKNRQATHYLSGPAAKTYLDAQAFAEEGVKVEFIRYPEYPPYPQLFPPFVPQLSIIDLLMHLGPAATAYLYSKSDRQKLIMS